jgi:hypothetical protein
VARSGALVCCRSGRCRSIDPKDTAIPKGMRLKTSCAHQLGAQLPAQNHTRICRENQAVTVENWSVQGRTASSRGEGANPGKTVRQKSGLNRSMIDVSFGEFAHQVKYKARLDEAQPTMADRFFPPSQLCSTPACDFRNKDLTLKDRSSTCPQCGTTHGRNRNAAKNLENCTAGYAEKQRLSARKRT